MTTTAIVLLLLMLFRKASDLTRPLVDVALHAAADAEAARRKAAESKHPADVQKAEQAIKKAEDLSKAAAQQEAAKKVPPPWPQAIPKGLPPFPGGWEYDQPPPQAVQARAWQLLPILWKSGPGTRKTEKTAGRWITYRSEKTKGDKKGVVAYRIKSAFLPKDAA